LEDKLTNPLEGEDKNKLLFSFFIMSYQSNSMIHLGKMKDPTTQKHSVNLKHAKLAIDILEMLQEKTKGNLTKAESELLIKVLNDLRLEYATESGSKINPNDLSQNYSC